MQRILCHIQVFALARWLSVKWPVEFYEFSRHLQWTIPSFSVPWESGPMSLFMVGSSPFGSSSSSAKALATIPNMLLGQNLNYGASVYGSLLTSSEYQQYFEVRIKFIYQSSRKNDNFFYRQLMSLINNSYLCRAQI